MEGPQNLVLPTLCHPHIHLDKAYILTGRCLDSPTSLPDYLDLVPESGTFEEALRNTSKAKERYNASDLSTRGSQLLIASYNQGVTAVRAFVELDTVTGTKTLEQAVLLKEQFKDLVHVQICAFAQDPLFSPADTEDGANKGIIEKALVEFRDHIDVLGTTPYVESSEEGSIKNIKWAIDTAIRLQLHLDFHLDYNLHDPQQPQSPMIYRVIETLKEDKWLEKADSSKTIVLGHCTQLTRLTKTQLGDLADSIKLSRLPIHFVGLPTSDIFMMGRPQEPSSASDVQHYEPHSRPRGTLQVLSLINDYGLNACIGVNNLGNAFTPFGTGDPLQLASWCVGLYQAGTPADAKALFECVSSRAKTAIGLPPELFPLSHLNNNHPTASHQAPVLVVENKTEDAILGTDIKIAARQRLDYKDVIWDPPDVSARKVIRAPSM